jgi:hypothetical protein
MTAPSLAGILCLFVGLLALAAGPAAADTPGARVTTGTVGPGQAYPEVASLGEGWFDVAGFCKIVDVADLSAVRPVAVAVPVFIPGTDEQWARWRRDAAHAPGPPVTTTTCCRPQANIATLCAGAFNPTTVGRQYGRLGETDVISATCSGPDGQYQESVPLSCRGDNGPDGQAIWQAGSDTDICTPDAHVTYGGCNVSCGGGRTYETVHDSCGNVTAQGYFGPACNTQSCCTPQYSKSCNESTAIYTDTSCGAGSYTVPGGCTKQKVMISYNSCSPYCCVPTCAPNCGAAWCGCGGGDPNCPPTTTGPWTFAGDECDVLVYDNGQPSLNGAISIGPVTFVCYDFAWQ